jgi:hypothetical protein
MGRACLKEGLNGVKVRIRRKNMLGEGSTEILLFAERGAFGHRHLWERPVPIFPQTGPHAHSTSYLLCGRLAGNYALVSENPIALTTTGPLGSWERSSSNRWAIPTAYGADDAVCEPDRVRGRSNTMFISVNLGSTTSLPLAMNSKRSQW